MLTIKLIALPLCAWFICDRFALSTVERQMLILFAAMPPATAAYVLTVRMGGDARAVSLLISVGTPLSALTLPIWLSLIS
jgi:malonate transporter and related proteins